MTTSESRRAGTVSVAELLLVLSLFVVVLAGTARYVAGHARLAARQAAELRLIEAARTARLVLGAEARALAPYDIAVRSADSVRIRAFRGGGIVCEARDARVGVRYRGIRQPDPAKDSALLLAGDGTEYARRLTDAGWAGCGGDAMLLDLEPVGEAGGGWPAGSLAYALVFETGSYHLSDAALRYRRGLSGRQPLVEAILGPARFDAGAGASIGFDAVARPDSLPMVRRRFRVVAPALNAAVP